MSQLLDQMRDRIRTLHYSIRTEDSYVLWAKQFILFHRKRHPLEMGEAEVGEFLTYLAVERNVAASTQNQALTRSSSSTKSCSIGPWNVSRMSCGPRSPIDCRLSSRVRRSGRC